MNARRSAPRGGFGGIALRVAVVIYILLLVALPLVRLFEFGLEEGLSEFWKNVTAPSALSALWLTVWTGLVVAIAGLFFGTLVAWVLVRYRFPGRAAIAATLDLPLAVPTLVAGIMLAVLYGPESAIGEALSGIGVDVIFAQPGIVLALLFVTLPFVVRAVEPVLLEIDPSEEEAAVVLGAGPFKVFRTVFFPAIAPAAISGAIRAFGRAIGEFGAIVLVAGNNPARGTLTAPVYIFGEIESGAPHRAAAVAIVLLLVALSLHAIGRWVETRTRHA